MRLTHIALSGFRGFREPLRIDLPKGFAIITGRNGAGKSTICDAFEYALSGTIRATSRHKEKGETIDDYLWWRGSGTIQDAYVEIGLRRPDGSEFSIRRSPKGASLSQDAIERLLVEPGAALEDSIKQVCRTTMLRDEEITTISVDLRETERFEFVRTALGSADFSLSEVKLKKVHDLLKGEHDLAQRDYELQRERATVSTTRLSQARADASRKTVTRDAEMLLQEFVGRSLADIADLIGEAEKKIAAERTRIDSLVRGFARLKELTRRREQANTSEYKAQLETLQSQYAETQAEAASSKALAEQLSKELAIAQQNSPRLGSLAQLHEHGARVGLQDGCCPLCGKAQGLAEFESHLAKSRAQLREDNDALAALSQSSADASASAQQHAVKLRNLRRKLDEMQSIEVSLLAEIDGLRREMIALGLPETSASEDVLSSLSGFVDGLRVRCYRSEEAVSVLRVSRAASYVIGLSREAAGAQERLVKSEKRLSRLASAIAQTREALQTVRRLQGELVDEQLAELSPLLVELYQRLRPHVDWQSVRYNLRGDVRRMLSLEIGSGLNPNFVFSSGQRRTAGLAFLLSLYLSRAWCQLRTLFLDDPVQHVDDYRALHLAEVLAAIRRSGHQVICTVEDHALAELLARRLRSDTDDEGAVIQLAYESGRGACLAGQRPIRPFLKQVLLAG